MNAGRCKAKCHRRARFRVAWLWLFFSAPTSFAQGPKGNPSELLADALAEVYQTRAEKLAERHIDREDFQIRAEVEASDVQPDIPYLSKGASSEALRSFSPARLSLLAKKVEIRFLSLRKLGKANEQALRDIIVSGLGLRTERGDTVSFALIEMDRSWSKSSLEREVDRLDANFKLEQKKFEEMKKDRGDLKLELTAAKGEIERLKSQLQEKTTEATTLRNLSKDATGAIPESTRMLLKRYLPHFMISFGIIVVLSIFVLVLFASGKKLGSAFNEIARALERGGAEVSQGFLAHEIPRSAASSETDVRPVESKPAAIPIIPLESLQLRLLSLNEEISIQLNPMTEAIILRHLTKLLRSPQDVARAVVSMELLGPKKANELFGRLSLEAQDAVLKFLKSGSYGRAKGELMLEAGEEIVTKLMADSFTKLRCAYSEKVSERLLKLRPEELVKVFRILDTKLLPRLMLYLDPSTISSVLRALKRQDDKRYGKTISLLARVPDGERDVALDDELIASLDIELSRIREDAHRPYLRFYQELIELSDDEQGEEIFAQLCAADSRLENFLKNQMVSLHTFFALSDDLRREVLASMPNREIAAFALGLSEPEQQFVVGAVSSRRRPLIAEELETLRSQGDGSANAAFRSAKQLVIARLRKIQDQGLSFGTIESSSMPKAGGALGQDGAGSRLGSISSRGKDAA